MLTATIQPTNETTATVPAGPSQNETALSDFEIMDRVLSIRSTWSPQERVERRREADRRFARLIDALCGEAA